MRKFRNRSLRLIALTSLALLISISSASAQVTVFLERFNAGNANGWTLGQDWQIGAATASAPPGNCGFFGDPGFDADGVPGGAIAGVVIGGNPSTALHAGYYLTSPLIPLPSHGTATLQFARWLNSDFGIYMSSTVEVFDGVNWNVVYQNPNFPCVTDAAWTNVSYDVSAYMNPAFRVRFGFSNVAAGVYVASSWNIDNVRVTALPNESLINGSFETTYPPAPYSLILQSSTAGSAWTVVNGNYECMGSNFWPPSDGTRSIDLNGNTAGTISNQSRVFANKAYAILFDLGANFAGPATSQLVLTVTFDGALGLPPVSSTFSASAAGNSISTMNWGKKTFSFSTANAAAASGVATITFASATVGGSGNTIDNVRLVPIESIFNGSFELTPGTIGSPSDVVVPVGANTISGWTVTQGDVDRDANQNGTASDGGVSIDMCGTTAGTMQQAIFLLPNRSYRIDFDLAGNVIQPGPKYVVTSVIPNDPNLATVAQIYGFDSINQTFANMGWTTQSFYFTTSGAANAVIPATLKFQSLTSGAGGAYLDNVRLQITSGVGQANAVDASLKVNGVGALNAAGPWAEMITDTSGLALSWQGPANMPYILIGSTVDTFHTSISNLGLLDLGTPATTFSDVFIILDGTSFPGFLFYALDSTGTATTNFATNAIPLGTEFSVQGLVVQPPTSPAAFRFTAAHHLIKQF